MAANPLKQMTVLLKKADIFSSLTSSEIVVIAENSEFLEFDPERAVFSEGDPGTAMYIVDQGEIVVQKTDEDGLKTDIARFVKGNCFGELDLFAEGERNASALAMEDTRLLSFPKKGTSFATFLQKHPSLSARILHNFLEDISGRIRRANALIKENSPIVQELRKQVYRDKLTGLYNQTYITEKIGEFISKDSSGFALIISKPDNFKALNDAYGHDAGDTAIKIMGRAIRDFIGDDERTARYKGNAMAVLMPEASRDEAYHQAERIRDFISCLDVSEATGGTSFSITASVGITLYPEHGTEAEELITRTHELPLEGRKRGGGHILFPEDVKDRK